MFRGMFSSLGMIISKVTAFDLSNADINVVDWISQTNSKDLQFKFQRGILTLKWIISMLFLNPLPESLTHRTIKLRQRLRRARATIFQKIKMSNLPQELFFYWQNYKLHL